MARKVLEIGEWQLCPKCNGNGVIPALPLSTATTQQCDVCFGAKILAKPIIEKIIFRGPSPRFKKD